MDNKIRLSGPRSINNSQEMFLIKYCNIFYIFIKLLEMRMNDGDTPFKLPGSDSPLKSNKLITKRVLLLLRLFMVVKHSEQMCTT